MSFAFFQHISPHVIALIRNNDAILVQIKNDDYNKEGYYRPPGCPIEFGESCIQSLEREFRCTYGVDLGNIRLINWIESICFSSSHQYHELIAVCEAEMQDTDYYNREIIYGMQGDTPCFCFWQKVTAIPTANSLYPAALSHILQS